MDNAKYKLVDYNVPTAGRLAALLFNYKNINFEYVQVDKSKAHEQETGKSEPVSIREKNLVCVRSRDRSSEEARNFGC